MHPEYARAALHASTFVRSSPPGGARRPRGSAEPAASARMRPRKLLREVPDQTGARARSARPDGAAARGCARASCQIRSPGRADRSSRTPSPTANACAPPGTPYLVDHVCVARLALHRARLAEHVHQTALRAAVRHEPGHLGVAAERAHVVDEARPGARAPRVRPPPWRYRSRSAGGWSDPRSSAARPQPLDHREHAAQLLLGRDTGGAWPCGLAADVEDVGAFGRRAPGRAQPRRRPPRTGHRRRTSRA